MTILLPAVAEEIPLLPRLSDDLLAIGALIGALITFGVYAHRQHTRRHKLRAALHAEIKQGGHWLESVNDNDKDELELVNYPDKIVNIWLPDHIYESSADSLGLLSQSEQSAVIIYYSYLKSLQRHLDRIGGEEEPSNDYEEEGESSNDSVAEADPSNDWAELNQLYQQTVRSCQCALNEIRENHNPSKDSYEQVTFDEVDWEE